MKLFPFATWYLEILGQAGSFSGTTQSEKSSQSKQTDQFDQTPVFFRS
jgi:hypothetical protein